MSFTETEKVDLRRFMGYPAYGVGAAGFSGWRYFKEYGTVEFRLRNMSAEEETYLRSLLTQIRTLETDIYGVRDNADTAAAAVWTRNPDELPERLSLYMLHRRRLCDFFGMPPGPNMGGGRNVQLVV